MAKPRYKTTNWKYYNQSLINRGSLTFWIDDETVQLWKQIKQGSCRSSRLFSDLAITTDLMVKRVFSMLLRCLQGFINSIFKLAQLLLPCPHYSCTRKRAKTVNVSFKTKTKGSIQHLAIDATGGRGYGEALLNLLKQTRRRIVEISGDGAYDTSSCYEAIHIKRESPLLQ